MVAAIKSYATRNGKVIVSGLPIVEGRPIIQRVAEEVKREAKPPVYTPTTAHETYINSVRALICNRFAVHNAEDQKKLDLMRQIKIMYGVGSPNLRGHCIYGVWGKEKQATKDPLIEICAFGEDDKWQLAGTTLHELAHAIAGHEAGHGKGWKEHAERLGLRFPKAAGHQYIPASFVPDLRNAINALADPRGHGAPSLRSPGVTRFRVGAGGCKGGVGSRGGKSRGVGSGSRLRLYVCECEKPVKVRVASDTFAAHCDACGAAFKQPEASADKR